MLFADTGNAISSARLQMLFMALTQVIWSLAFSSSVTSSDTFIYSTIRDNDKYQFLSLLDEAINLDEIVPVSFRVQT